MDHPFDYPRDGPTKLYIAARDQLEKFEQVTLGARRGAEFAIATHRRDRPGLGSTVPTPLANGYMVVVQLRPGGWCDMQRDARHEASGELSTGHLTIMDLRHLWVAELLHSFHSFSFVVPQAMLDELTEDFGQPRIDSLRCSVASGIEDPVILNLARALYPALEKTQASTSSLTLTHLFEAATVHLAQHYGGLKAQAFESVSGLAAWQVRRAKEMLSDSLHADVIPGELSKEFDLTSFRFSCAFTKSVGLPPHKWMMVHRIESAKKLLAVTAQSNESIAKFCGFSDASQFDLAFARLVGATPDRFRRDRRQ